jgi:hypothetical protein
MYLSDTLNSLPFSCDNRIKMIDTNLLLEEAPLTLHVNGNEAAERNRMRFMRQPYE